MLQLLLQAEIGGQVCLEVFEDVGWTDASTGATTASQTKTGLVVNPLTNRSPQLWTTLSNWLDAIDAEVLVPAQTVFEIYVARRHEPGVIANLLHRAKTEDEARAAVERVRQAF